MRCVRPSQLLIVLWDHVDPWPLAHELLQLLLQRSHLDSFHGARQLAVYLPVQDIRFEYFISKITLLPCTVSCLRTFTDPRIIGTS